MSFCRWSSDNFRSDLYCYEDVNGGFTTMVAGNKIITPIIPEPPYELLTGWKIWAWRFLNTFHRWSLDLAIHRKIGLPHDGKHFNDATLEEFRERIVWLRSLGYKCPDYVLERIDEELKEAE